MSIPPAIVAFSRDAWKWEWIQLMKGLAPADEKGNFKRVPSHEVNAIAPAKNNLQTRSKNEYPVLNKKIAQMQFIAKVHFFYCKIHYVHTTPTGRTTLLRAHLGIVVANILLLLHIQ